MLNRREALQAALGTAVGAAAIPVVAADVVDVKKPFLAVIRCDQKLSMDNAERIRESWRNIVSKTDYPDLPLVILQGGMTLEIIDDPRGAAC